MNKAVIVHPSFRTATVRTILASLDHNPTAAASDRKEELYGCTRANGHFVRGQVYFTDTCIVESMLNMWGWIVSCVKGAGTHPLCNCAVHKPRPFCLWYLLIRMPKIKFGYLCVCLGIWFSVVKLLQKNTERSVRSYIYLSKAQAEY